MYIIVLEASLVKKGWLFACIRPGKNNPPWVVLSCTNTANHHEDICSFIYVSKINKKVVYQFDIYPFKFPAIELSDDRQIPRECVVSVLSNIYEIGAARCLRDRAKRKKKRRSD